jgi:transcriptional regulator with XRE-family HTH domain
MRVPGVRPLDLNTEPQLALALVSALDSGTAASVFAAARLRRQLSRDEVAQRSGITAEQVRWLEESRVYAFRSPEDALAAALLLASGLEIDNHEARELAGLPRLPRPIQANPRGRLALGGVLVLVLLAAALMLGYALHGQAISSVASAPANSLAPAWRVKVEVLNGSGDINYARRVASRIQALGYRITGVKRATRFDYRHTTVFYADRGKGSAIGARLAKALGAELLPLPHGTDPMRLVVITGPANLGLR